MNVTFPLILLGVFLNASAQLLLKAGMNHIGHFAFAWQNIIPIGIRVATNLPIVIGLSFYVLSVVVWLLVLSRVEVSYAYPMISLGYIVNAIGAYYFFGESLSFTRLIAIGVIIIGVYLISRT